MATGNDLNNYLPARINGDYGILDPVNAWPDASERIRLAVRWLPDGRLWQEGMNVNSDDPRMWARVRSVDARVWSEWTLVGSGGGEPGQRGSSWDSGEGPPPTDTSENLPGDQYLDTATGNVYEFQAAASVTTVGRRR